MNQLEALLREARDWVADAAEDDGLTYESRRDAADLVARIDAELTPLPPALSDSESDATAS